MTSEAAVHPKALEQCCAILNRTGMYFCDGLSNDRGGTGRVLKELLNRNKNTKLAVYRQVSWKCWDVNEISDGRCVLFPLALEQ